jgi:hypothetical protein
MPHRRRNRLSIELLEKEEIYAIRQEVRKRDQGRCLLCGRCGAHVHELLFRSSAAPRAKKVFQMKLMGCICGWHHHSLHSEGGYRLKYTLWLLIVLRSRYRYRYNKRLEKYIETAAKMVREGRLSLDNPAIPAV